MADMEGDWLDRQSLASLMSSSGCKHFETDMWADCHNLPDNLRIDGQTCSNAESEWGNMVNDATASTEVVSER